MNNPTLRTTSTLSPMINQATALIRRWNNGVVVAYSAIGLTIPISAVGLGAASWITPAVLPSWVVFISAPPLLMWLMFTPIAFVSILATQRWKCFAPALLYLSWYEMGVWLPTTEVQSVFPAWKIIWVLSLIFIAKTACLSQIKVIKDIYRTPGESRPKVLGCGGKRHVDGSENHAV